jgi:hypothetical protein
VIGKITWATETFQCADVSLVPGVEGTFGASGTLKFDLADLGAAKLGFNVKQNCTLGGAGIPGNLGGVLDGLPKLP